MPDVPEIDMSVLANAGEPAGRNGVASAATPARPQGARRPPPKRRGTAPAPAPVAQQAPETFAGSPPALAVPAPAPATVPTPAGVHDRGAVTAWPRILTEQAALGYTPEMLGLTVERTAIGPDKSPGKMMAPIDGGLVAGSEGISAGEELYNYFIDYYHRGTAGPAKYVFQVYRKSGGRPVTGGVCELSLDHPDVVLRQKQSIDELQRSRSAASARGFGAPSGAYGGGGYRPTGVPGYPPAPQQSPPAAAPLPPPQPPLVAQDPNNPREQELLRLLALERENGYLRGQRDQQQQPPPQQSQQQPPPYYTQPAPAPAPQPQQPAYDPRLPPRGLSDEEWEDILANRQARVLGPVVAQAVTQSLAALGFKPGGIGLGAQPAGAPATATPAAQAVPLTPPKPLTPAEKLAETLAPLKAAKAMIDGFKEVFGDIMPEPDAAAAAAAAEVAADDGTGMKPVMGGALKHPGTDMPVMFGPKMEDESWSEYLMRYFACNPSSGEMVLKYATKILDPKALSAFVERMASRGSAPQQQPPQPPTLGGSPPAKMGWAPTG